MEYIITFIEGIASFISPCILPIIPVYISYFATNNKSSKSNKFIRICIWIFYNIHTTWYIRRNLWRASTQIFKLYKYNIRIILNNNRAKLCRNNIFKNVKQNKRNKSKRK